MGAAESVDSDDGGGVLVVRLVAAKNDARARQGLGSPGGSTVATEGLSDVSSCAGEGDGADEDRRTTYGRVGMHTPTDAAKTCSLRVCEFGGRQVTRDPMALRIAFGMFMRQAGEPSDAGDEDMDALVAQASHSIFEAHVPLAVSLAEFLDVRAETRREGGNAESLDLFRSSCGSITGLLAHAAVVTYTQRDRRWLRAVLEKCDADVYERVTDNGETILALAASNSDMLLEDFQWIHKQCSKAMTIADAGNATVLHRAARSNGDESIVHYILQHAPDAVYARTRSGWTPVQTLVRHRKNLSVHCFGTLYAASLSHACNTDKSAAVLPHALQNEHIPAGVVALLMTNEHVRLTERHDITDIAPLHNYLASGVIRADIITSLFADKGSALCAEAVDAVGALPLHCIVRNPHLTPEALRIVLQAYPAAASIVAGQYAGLELPLHRFLRIRQRDWTHPDIHECLCLLIDAFPAALKSRLPTKEYPLHVACANPSMDPSIVSLLAKRYPSAVSKAATSKHAWPVHLMLEHLCCLGIPTLRALLRLPKKKRPPSARNPVQAQDRAGRYAIHCAMLNPHVSLDVLDELLMHCPAALSLVDRAGKQALHTYLLHNSEPRADVVAWLLRHMCGPDPDDKTPAQLAACLQKSSPHHGTPLHCAACSPAVSRETLQLIVNAAPTALLIECKTTSSSRLPIECLPRQLRVASRPEIVQYFMDATDAVLRSVDIASAGPTTTTSTSTTRKTFSATTSVSTAFASAAPTSARSLAGLRCALRGREAAFTFQTGGVPAAQISFPSLVACGHAGALRASLFNASLAEVQAPCELGSALAVSACNGHEDAVRATLGMESAVRTLQTLVVRRAHQAGIAQDSLVLLMAAAQRHGWTWLSNTLEALPTLSTTCLAQQDELLIPADHVFVCSRLATIHSSSSATTAAATTTSTEAAVAAARQIVGTNSGKVRRPQHIDAIFRAAILSGNMSLVKRLSRQEFPDHPLPRDSLSWAMGGLDSILLGAGQGQHTRSRLGMVEFLCADGADSRHALDHAVRYGHMDCLRWLHVHHPTATCTTNAVLGAAEQGHVDAMIWLRVHRNCRMRDDIVLERAVEASSPGTYALVERLLRTDWRTLTSPSVTQLESPPQPPLRLSRAIVEACKARNFRASVLDLLLKHASHQDIEKALCVTEDFAAHPLRQQPPNGLASGAPRDRLYQALRRRLNHAP